MRPEILQGPEHDHLRLTPGDWSTERVRTADRQDEVGEYWLRNQADPTWAATDREQTGKEFQELKDRAAHCKAMLRLPPDLIPQVARGEVPLDWARSFARTI